MWNPMSSDTFSLALDRMTCGACVARVDRVLARAAGGGNANLATETARMPASALAADIIAALTRAGFTPRQTTQALAVEGMTCASCISRVENALSRLPAVLSADANLVLGTVTVRALDGAQAVGGLVAAPEAMGYGAHAKVPTVAAEDALGKQGRQTMLSALLTLPVARLAMGGHLIPAFHHLIEAGIGEKTS